VTRRAFWLTLTLAALLSGCVSTLESYKPRSADEAQVVSTLMRIPNGIKARSSEVIMQPYADDVYIGNFHKYLGTPMSGATTVIKKADLRWVYEQVFKSSREISLDVKDFKVTVSGDRAVAEARTELLIKLEAGKREKRQEVFYNEVLWRLARTPLGWKIKEEIYQ
jgi:ketosteroid isomerase-like protein